MERHEQRIYVGVDVAKASFVAAWACGEQAAVIGEFPNDRAGYQALGMALSKLNNKQRLLHLVVEPTGGYEGGILTYGQEQQWAMSRVNPFRVRRWAQGVGQRGKTDRLDALMLARFGQATRPAPQSLLAQEADELEGLTRRKEDLAKLLRAEENRLAQLKQRARVPKAVQESLERVIATLKEQIEAIDESVR